MLFADCVSQSRAVIFSKATDYHSSMGRIEEALFNIDHDGNYSQYREIRVLLYPSI